MHNGTTPKRAQVYVASPLFSDSERRLNVLIRNALTRYLNVYLPQERVGLVSDMVKGGEACDEAVCQVFRLDIAAIQESDALLIVLDGRAVDEGAAFELGFAYANGKPCVGLQTDSRRTHVWGNNPMIHESVRPILRSVEALVEWARRFSTSSEVMASGDAGTPRAVGVERKNDLSMQAAS